MGFVFTKAARGKILRYSALYIFPFLIMLMGGFALQLVTRKIEAGFVGTSIYAALTLILAMGIAFVVRRSQVGLKMKPFIWGKPSSLFWGLAVGLMISITTGIGFGISQGYSFHWENLFHHLAMNALGQASPALAEEVVFRAGIVHSTLFLLGKSAGLASGSVPFGLLHLAGLLFGQSVTATQIFGISLAGLMLSLMYLRFGILGAFATHLTWNTLVGGWINVYGLTDRGTVVSALEGSWVICLVLSMTCAILFLLPIREREERLDDDRDVDVSQLERNLRLTPERRLLEHQAALELCEKLAWAGRRIHEQSQ